MIEIVILAIVELVAGSILSFVLGPVLDQLTVALSTPTTANLFTVIGQLHAWSFVFEALTIVGFLVTVFAASKS